MTKLIGGIVAVVLVVGAFFVWQGKQAVAPGDQLSSNKEELPTDSDNRVVSIGEKGKQTITSIRDAMSLGVQIKCSYVHDVNGQSVQSQVIVSGKQFMSTSTVMKDVTAYELFDGERLYSWTSGSKKGMKMDQTCLDSVKNIPSEAAPLDTQDSLADFNSAKNVQCEPVELDPPIAMSIPKDVSFTDQCAMMQESLKMMEQMKDKLPAGMGIPTIPQMGPIE